MAALCFVVDVKMCNLKYWVPEDEPELGSKHVALCYTINSQWNVICRTINIEKKMYWMNNIKFINVLGVILQWIVQRWCVKGCTGCHWQGGVQWQAVFSVWRDVQGATDRVVSSGRLCSVSSVIILSDNYHFSLSLAARSCMWAGSWVSYIRTINEQTGSSSW